MGGRTRFKSSSPLGSIPESESAVEPQLPRKSDASLIPSPRGKNWSDQVALFMEKNIRLGEKLGTGTFGVVKHGTYLEDDVRVKVLQWRDGTFDERRQKREALLVEEAHLVERKRSQHIAKLWHYCPNKKWLVFEYSANGTLRDFMKKQCNKTIVGNWSNRLRWLTQVALGMYSAHEEHPRLLHRDLKTSNIFITEHLDAKVGDFGLSAKMEEQVMQDGATSPRQDWMIWQPAEVTENFHYTKKSDVYSFGVIMYELLTLKEPCMYKEGRVNKATLAQNFIKENGEWNIPLKRPSLPENWHSCLEKYIDLMKNCCANDPRIRPHFREISTQLKKIWEEYDKAMKFRNNTFPPKLGDFLKLVENIAHFALSGSVATEQVQDRKAEKGLQSNDKTEHQEVLNPKEDSNQSPRP